MTATIVANASIGQCIPTTAALIGQLTAELEGKLAGFLSIQSALTFSPPALDAQLQGAATLVAQIQAQIAAGLTVAPPGVSLSIAATAAAVAELTASLAALFALTVTLGTAGVSVISYDGEAQRYGSEMQAQVNNVAPAGNAVQAITFMATEPAVFAALGTVMLTG